MFHSVFHGVSEYTVCLYTPTCITSVVPPIHIDQLRKVYALDSLCTVIVLEEVFYISSVDHINDSFGHNVGGVCSVSLFVMSFPGIPRLLFTCPNWRWLVGYILFNLRGQVPLVGGGGMLWIKKTWIRGFLRILSEIELSTPFPRSTLTVPGNTVGTTTGARVDFLNGV